MNHLSHHAIKVESSEMIQPTKEDPLLEMSSNNTKANKLQMIPKDKHNHIKKHKGNNALKKENDKQSTAATEIRLDAYGIPISKRKKQKVTFIDKLNPNQQFIEEHKVESFKVYNVSMSYPDNHHDGLGKRQSLCVCNVY